MNEDLGELLADELPADGGELELGLGDRVDIGRGERDAGERDPSRSTTGENAACGFHGVGASTS